MWCYRPALIAFVGQSASQHGLECRVECFLIDLQNVTFVVIIERLYFLDTSVLGNLDQLLELRLIRIGSLLYDASWRQGEHPVRLPYEEAVRQSSVDVGFHKKLRDWFHQVCVDVVLVVTHVFRHNEFTWA